MKENFRKVLEIVAIITGISGITLSNFRESYSIAFYSTIVLLIFIILITFVSWKEDNIFKSKAEIARVWKQLLLGASRSVKIFAGDVSWIERDKDTIAARNKEGLIVSVICRKPHNEKTSDNVLQLLQSGAQVKYYSSSDVPNVRGLIIDDGEDEKSTALTIYKSAKEKIMLLQDSQQEIVAKRGSGLPGDTEIFQYEGVRYFPSKDIRQIQILNNLFNAVWDNTIYGVVLRNLEIDNKSIARLINVVPHYSKITSNDIRMEVLDISSLWSTCSYVKDYKFLLTQSVMEAFESQQIQPFMPSLCISHLRKSILLPPIVEENKGKFIIVDGMHRLFFRFAFMQKTDALCLVISTNLDLPSTPIPFENVQIWPRKLSRKQVFRNYKPEMFRNIDLLDQILKEYFEKYV